MAASIVELVVIVAVAIFLHSVVFLSGTVLTTFVMPVNPVVMVMRPMPRHPNHFPVALPIRLAVEKWPISNLDLDAFRADDGRSKGTRKDCDR